MEQTAFVSVIGSDDGKSLSKKHLGDMKYFWIYKVKSDGSWEFLKKVKNTSPEEKKHGDTDKMKKILSILPDVDVFIGRVFSPNFFRLRDTTPIQPVVVESDSVENALKIVAENFGLIYSLIEKRKNGERPPELPLLK